MIGDVKCLHFKLIDREPVLNRTFFWNRNEGDRVYSLASDPTFLIDLARK
jgi:hypothetical protein